MSDSVRLSDDVIVNLELVRFEREIHEHVLRSVIDPKAVIVREFHKIAARMEAYVATERVEQDDVVIEYDEARNWREAWKAQHAHKWWARLLVWPRSFAPVRYTHHVWRAEIKDRWIYPEAAKVLGPAVKHRDVRVMTPRVSRHFDG